MNKLYKAPYKDGRSPKVPHIGGPIQDCSCHSNKGGAYSLFGNACSGLSTSFTVVALLIALSIAVLSADSNVLTGSANHTPFRRTFGRFASQSVGSKLTLQPPQNDSIELETTKIEERQLADDDSLYDAETSPDESESHPQRLPEIDDLLLTERLKKESKSQFLSSKQKPPSGSGATVATTTASVSASSHATASTTVVTSTLTSGSTSGGSHTTTSTAPSDDPDAEEVPEEVPDKVPELHARSEPVPQRSSTDAETDSDGSVLATVFSKSGDSEASERSPQSPPTEEGVTVSDTIVTELSEFTEPEKAPAVPQTPLVDQVPAALDAPTIPEDPQGPPTQGGSNPTNTGTTTTTETLPASPTIEGTADEVPVATETLVATELTDVATTATLSQGAGRATPQKLVDPMSDAWDNSIAVCAIMMQEQINDIREWLLYHKWLGVDRIFLRENTQSTHVSADVQEQLQDLIDIGFLDLATWGGKSPEAQQMWYNKCTEKELGGRYSWILFSDLDEYPVLMDGGVAVENPDLKRYMARQRGVMGLSLQWVMFGSSGIRDRPETGGPLQHFDKCLDELSHDMKCFASSYHLADYPFIGPEFIHSCCYHFDESQTVEEWPPVLFADGRPVNASWIQKGILAHSSTPLTRAENHQKCRTNRGVLVDEDWENHKDIPQGETLVLFHFMTRSFEDFRANKLSRYAGRYVNDFLHRRKTYTNNNAPVPPDEVLFDQLEHDLKIDRDEPVCASAMAANYAERCCSEG